MAVKKCPKGRQWDKKKNTCRTYKQKFESCVKQVKAKQPAKCKRNKYPTIKGQCYNPWAVCKRAFKKF